MKIIYVTWHFFSSLNVSFDLSTIAMDYPLEPFKDLSNLKSVIRSSEIVISHTIKVISGDST